MNLIQRWIDQAVRLTAVIGFVAIALMMLQISLDVVGRFIFQAPSPATITIVSSYYMVVVAFLPLALAERRNSHIAVEVVTETLPARWQRHIGGWTNLFSATVFALLGYRTFIDALAKYSTGSFVTEQGIKIVIWPGHFLLPIGAGLMVAVLILKFIRYLTGREETSGDRSASTE